MLQELEKNGLKNLEPMDFWKNVIVKHKHYKPRVLLMLDSIRDNLAVVEIAQKHSECDFMIETPEVENVGWLGRNISYRVKNQYREDRRNWANFDCVFGNEKDLDWVKVGLSGADVVFGIDGLKEYLKRPRVLSSVERVENFDRIKNIVDKVKKDC